MVRPFSIFSPTFAKIHQSSMSSADYVRAVGTGEGQGGWVGVHAPHPDFARSVNSTSTKRRRQIMPRTATYMDGTLHTDL